MKIYSILVVLLTSLCFAACSDPKKPDQSAPAPTAEERIQRGAYLVQISGCNDCHSPKQMGAKGPELVAGRLLSGYPSDRGIPAFDTKMTAQGFAMFTPDLTAAYGPWGVSFAANLTPDDTGIGNWTFEQFKKALTEGKAKGLDGGRMLLPPMPWTNYINIREEDLQAIFAYLKSIPAVKNIVPAPVPPASAK